MAMNIEQRLEQSAKSIEQSSQKAHDFAEKDTTIQTCAGSRDSLPKVSRIWQENFARQMNQHATEFQDRFALSQQSLPWQAGITISDSLQRYHVGVQGEEGYKEFLPNPLKLPFETAATLQDDLTQERWLENGVPNKHWTEREVASALEKSLGVNARIWPKGRDLQVGDVIPAPEDTADGLPITHVIVDGNAYAMSPVANGLVSDFDAARATIGGVSIGLTNQSSYALNTFETFKDALNASTTQKKIKTARHSFSNKGSAEYVRNGLTGNPVTGDEISFFNALGIGYSLSSRTVTLEQLGAFDGADIAPLIIKAANNYSKLNRLKSEGGNYIIGSAHYTSDGVVNLELDLRNCSITVTEEIDIETVISARLSRLDFPNSTSLTIKHGNIDFDGKFCYRLFTAFDATRCKYRNYGEVKNCRWPSDSNPVDSAETNLTGVFRYSGHDIEVIVGDHSDMYNKNYDGSLAKIGHLGRCYDGSGSKVRVKKGSFVGARTPIANHEVNNIRWEELNFSDVTDNGIYDLDCSNSIGKDLSFINCIDEPIVTSGVNKKWIAVSAIDCGGRCIALNGYYRNMQIIDSDFINAGFLSAIKTRIEVTELSEDITVSGCYFKSGAGANDFVNYIGNCKKVKFTASNRFDIANGSSPTYIGTFGIVNLLSINDNDFGNTKDSMGNRNSRVIRTTGSFAQSGSTKLQVWNNAGLEEENLAYPAFSKLPLEVRAKDNFDIGGINTLEEFKANMHLSAPVTGGAEGRGFCISIALDDNIYSGDQVRTGGFVKFAKYNGDNGDPSMEMQIWASKATGDGYELIMRVNRDNKLGV
ncbi:hypothetical protein [Vibrio cholerae]|uniref:hypothetical protein n=1 Tax=Vibrio cholerae TaxID=666 RepID=UPI001E3F2C49|nr:hypothetical protein [Vibrio cholerae]